MFVEGDIMKNIVFWGLLVSLFSFEANSLVESCCKF